MIHILNLHINMAIVTVLFVGNLELLSADIAASVLKLLNMLLICG